MSTFLRRAGTLVIIIAVFGSLLALSILILVRSRRRRFTAARPPA